MTNDDRLHDLLRSALARTDASAPRRDLWPDVMHRRRTPIRISPADVGAAALVGLMLLLFPQWLLLLAYHL
jgi:hypothetical protein